MNKNLDNSFIELFIRWFSMDLGWIQASDTYKYTHTSVNKLSFSMSSRERVILFECEKQSKIRPRSFYLSTEASLNFPVLLSVTLHELFVIWCSCFTNLSSHQNFPKYPSLRIPHYILQLFCINISCGHQCEAPKEKLCNNPSFLQNDHF